MLLLLLSAAGAAPAVVAPVAAPAATVGAGSPARHPTFTVRMVGKSRSMLHIPGLICPDAVWDEVVSAIFCA